MIDATSSTRSRSLGAEDEHHAASATVETAPGRVRERTSRTPSTGEVHPVTHAINKTVKQCRTAGEIDVVRRGNERLHDLLAAQEAHREKAWAIEERGFSRELTRDERRQVDYEHRKADEVAAAIRRLSLEHGFDLLAAVEDDVRDALS
jgi:hypothetical protein